MKHVLAIGRDKINNAFCSSCYAENVTNRVAADVLIEEMPYIPEKGELLPTNRTVYGLCATHAEVENLVQ